MGRYTGPACRLCRREGMKICDKHKCATVKRNYPPGMHGKDQHSKPSDFAKQLREKQKARRIFGISEKQIKKYYNCATASPEESGLELLRQMETRLDNAVFRSGLATTRRQARQWVAHGLFTLNGKRINVPSVQVKANDVFALREKNKKMPAFVNFEKKKLNTPSWLKLDAQALSGQVLSRPAKEDVELAIAPQMIIEFYSR